MEKLVDCVNNLLHIVINPVYYKIGVLKINEKSELFDEKRYTI